MRKLIIIAIAGFAGGMLLALAGKMSIAGIVWALTTVYATIVTRIVKSKNQDNKK